MIPYSIMIENLQTVSFQIYLGKYFNTNNIGCNKKALGISDETYNVIVLN